jgi:hypothetical protein
MGWSYTHRPAGYTDLAWFARELPTCTIHDCATVRGTFYAAVSNNKNPDVIFAVVILTRWNNRARDGFNFGCKDLDESMGPYQTDCPARILDRLAAPLNDYSAEWRARCRAQLAKPVPRIGQVIRLKEPVSFGGIPESILIRDSLPRKKNIFRTPGGRYVRFSNFRDYDYEVIEGGAV